MSSTGRAVVRSLITPLTAAVVTLAFLTALLAGVAVLLLTAAPTSAVAETKLTPSDGATADQFGFAVSVSGDTALVGATGGVGHIPDPEIGSAYVS